MGYTIIDVEKEDGTIEQLIHVEFPNVYTKEMMKWTFREFTMEEFGKLKISKPEMGEEGTVAQILKPTAYMINEMMVSGDRIMKDTRTFVINGLKSALRDFLA